MRTKLYFNWLERARWFRGRELVCAYCGIEVFLGPCEWERKATIDHRTPIARGGSFGDEANLAVACMGCNQTKGQMTAEEWLRALADAARQLELPGLEAPSSTDSVADLISYPQACG